MTFFLLSLGAVFYLAGFLATAHHLPSALGTLCIWVGLVVGGASLFMKLAQGSRHTYYALMFPVIGWIPCYVGAVYGSGTSGYILAIISSCTCMLYTIRSLSV